MFSAALLIILTVRYSPQQDTAQFLFLASLTVVILLPVFLFLLFRASYSMNKWNTVLKKKVIPLFFLMLFIVVCSNFLGTRQNDIAAEMFHSEMLVKTSGATTHPLLRRVAQSCKHYPRRRLCQGIFELETF
jgi:uncharacterized membrane protein